MLKTAERVHCTDRDNYVYQRSLKAYIESEKYIKGDVLELGCGEAYYINQLATNCNRYIAIDKYKSKRFNNMPPNVEFINMRFPPLKYIAFNSYDIVICFQVLEHIENDIDFLKEVYRVLKPNGVFILTTPNRKMTITRNPWHVREYEPLKLKGVLNKIFDEVNLMGIRGNEKVTMYYNENLKTVSKLSKIDFLNVHKKIPAILYRKIYDILNIINRKILARTNNHNTEINYLDFNLCCETEDKMLDIFCIATKNKLKLNVSI